LWYRWWWCGTIGGVTIAVVTIDGGPGMALSSVVVVAMSGHCVGLVVAGLIAGVTMGCS